MSKKPQKIKSISKPKPVEVSAHNNSKIDFYLLAIGAATLLISLIRWRLMSMPLERDEGEYAYLGSLILDGIPPYKEAYNMKLPGTYFMYAVLMGIFGKSITGVHFGLLIINAATMALLFFGFKKLFNPMVGLVTSACYGLMAISFNFLGFAAHATHFVSFYVALGIFFYTKFDSNRKFVYSLLVGIMFGMSFLMKQQAVFFILFGGIVVLVTEYLNRPVNTGKSLINILGYSLGVFLPYLLLLLIMYVTGVFDKFWFWTIEYAGKYAAGVSFEEGKMLFGMSFKPMWEEFMFYWILAAIGVGLVFLGKYQIKQIIFAIAFTLFAFLSICPGFYFRQHYFIPLLPAVGLMVAITLDYCGRLMSGKFKINGFIFVPLIVFIIIGISVVAKNKVYYLKTKPQVLSKMIYGTNPFIESLEIGDYIKRNSKESDKIAILGSEPQLFLYADRKSATGHIYTYGMMEIHNYNKQMQEEMISQIEKEKPLFIIYCNIRTSWLPRPDSPMGIFDWYNKYTKENYQLVGVTDIPAQGPASYYWDASIQQPQNQEYILIYKRNI